MTTLLIIIHILVCLFLVAIVLLQHGKGADIGATFGGSSQSLFGSEGPVPLLNKITTFSAIVFMGTSVTLAYISAHKSSGSVMSTLPTKEAAAPVKKEQPITIPMPTTEQPPAETGKTEPVATSKEAETTTTAPTPSPAVQEESVPQTESQPDVPAPAAKEVKTEQQAAETKK